MDKKKLQLGMNPGTAAHRLRKNVMFSLVQRCGMDLCHQCGERIDSVEEFSIEHIKPWLDSEDPVGLFFDIENIAFSHHSCNVRAARREMAGCGTKAQYARGCRCEECCGWESSRKKKAYTPEKRHAKYVRTGT